MKIEITKRNGSVKIIDGEELFTELKGNNSKDEIKKYLEMLENGYIIGVNDIHYKMVAN